MDAAFYGKAFEFDVSYIKSFLINRIIDGFHPHHYPSGTCVRPSIVLIHDYKGLSDHLSKRSGEQFCLAACLLDCFNPDFIPVVLYFRTLNP